MTQTSKKKRIPKKDLAVIKKEIKGFSPTKPNIVSKPMDEAEDPSPELTLADEMPAAYAPRQLEHGYDYTDFDNALGDSTQDSTPVKDE